MLRREFLTKLMPLALLPMPQVAIQRPSRVNREGCVSVPQRPGLGVEINRDLVAKN